MPSTSLRTRASMAGLWRLAQQVCNPLLGTVVGGEQDLAVR